MFMACSLALDVADHSSWFDLTTLHSYQSVSSHKCIIGYVHDLLHGAWCTRPFYTHTNLFAHISVVLVMFMVFSQVLDVADHSSWFNLTTLHSYQSVCSHKCSIVMYMAWSLELDVPDHSNWLTLPLYTHTNLFSIISIVAIQIADWTAT